MPRLIEAPARVEAAGNKPKLIDEYVGRVNSGTDGVSVAHMRSPGGWVEPGQTPEFDEYTVVLRGLLRVESRGGVLDVRAGQAVIAGAGEWVRYSTPGPDGAEYLAVCLPAFSLEAAHRDEEAPPAISSPLAPATPARTAYGWRQWLVVGVIAAAFGMLTLLRSARWNGVVVQATGDVVTYRTSPWLLAVIAVPFVLMALIGVAVVTVRHPLARLVGGAVLLAVLGSAATVLPITTKVDLIVTPDGFVHTHGFWWAPVVNSVRFETLDAMRVVPERKGGERPSFLLQCRTRDRGVITMPLGDSLKAALPDLRARLARRAGGGEGAGPDGP